MSGMCHFEMCPATERCSGNIQSVFSANYFPRNIFLKGRRKA